MLDKVSFPVKYFPYFSFFFFYIGLKWPKKLSTPSNEKVFLVSFNG